MIWIIRLFLLIYAVLYFGIGAWAMIDPVRDALELGDIPSFMKAVGLQVTDAIGYSEVAGLYGGINMVIGLLCFLALFSRGITTFVLSLLAFLTFSNSRCPGLPKKLTFNNSRWPSCCHAFFGIVFNGFWSQVGSNLAPTWAPNPAQNLPKSRQTSIENPSQLASCFRWLSGSIFDRFSTFKSTKNQSTNQPKSPIAKISNKIYKKTKTYNYLDFSYFGHAMLGAKNP